MSRKSILNRAEEIVCNIREAQYGAPENNFGLTAALWALYLSEKPRGEEPTAHDVAVMMALLKIARIATGQVKADNYIDLAGYAALAGELAGGGASV